MISAINSMYHIKTSDASLEVKDYSLNVNFYHKLKLLLNCFPNIKLKRMLKKGRQKLEVELDLIEIIKEHKHVHREFKSKKSSNVMDLI